MSCFVCQKGLGLSYTIFNNVKMHKDCESKLQYCDSCYHRSIANGTCITCATKSRYNYKCDNCGTQLHNNGKLHNGQLMCSICISADYDKKMENIELCYKKGICYKCDSPIKKITESRCYGITGGGEEYVTFYMCLQKCGILKYI